MLQDSRSNCNRGSPPTGVPSAPAHNPAVNIRTIDLQAAGSGILNRSPSAPALLPSSMQFAGGDSFNTSRTLRDLYTASTNFQSAQTFLPQRQSSVHSAATNSAFNNVRLSNPNSSNTNHSHNHNSNSTSNSAMAMSGGGPTNPNQQVLKCPRCDSLNTKFCYYNNYSLLQPRHFCKNCRRYWTKGGALRNVPVGGGCRKNKRSSSSSTSSPSGSSTSASHSSSIANIGSSNRSISSSTNSIISNGIAAISSGSQISAKRHLYIPEHQNPSNSYVLNNSTASPGSSLFNPAMNSMLLASAQDYATSIAGSGTNLSSPGAGGTFSSLAINNSANLYHRLSLFGDPKLCMQQRQPTFISPKPFNSAIAAAAAAGQLNHTDALNLSSYCNGFNASPTLQSSLLDQIRRRSPQLNLPTQTYGMLQSSNDTFTDGSRAVTDVTNPNPNSCNLPSNFGSGKIAFSFNVGNSKHMAAAGITSDGQASVSCSSSSSSTSNPVQDFASFGALNLTTADLTGFAGASSTSLDRLLNPSSASTLGPAGSCRDQSLQGSGFGQLADYNTDDITTHGQVRLDPFIHGDLSENETADATAAASNLMSQNQPIQINAEDGLESLQGKPQHINRSGNDHNNHVCAGASDAEQAAAAAAANSIVINGDDDDDQNVWSHAATAGSAQDGFLGPSTDSSSFWNTSASAWPDHHHLQCAEYGSSTT